MVLPGYLTFSFERFSLFFFPSCALAAFIFSPHSRRHSSSISIPSHMERSAAPCAASCIHRFVHHQQEAERQFPGGHWLGRLAPAPRRHSQYRRRQAAGCCSHLEPRKQLVVLVHPTTWSIEPCRSCRAISWFRPIKSCCRHLRRSLHSSEAGQTSHYTKTLFHGEEYLQSQSKWAWV